MGKSTSEVIISDIKKETDFSGAGAQCHLTYLKEDPKPEGALKKVQDKRKPSLSEPRKHRAAEISPQKRNGLEKYTVGYANAEKSVRLAKLPKLFP